MKATHPVLTVLKDPTAQKYIKYGAMAIAGLIVFVIVKKKVKGLFDGSYGQRDQEKELRSLDIKEYKLTISEGEAMLITQNIFNAMNKVGTDEETVLRNLESLKTKDDLLQIIKNFGIKPYNGSSMTVSAIRAKLYSRDLNLNGWLATEMTGKAKDETVAIYQKLGVNF